MAMWHDHLGHPNITIVSNVLAQLRISIPSSKQLSFYEESQYGKLHQNTFPSLSTLRTNRPLHLIHTGAWYPALFSIEFFRYYLVVVDEFTCHFWIYPLHLKTEATPTCLQFITWLNVNHTKVKAIQSDWGAEFCPLQHPLQRIGILFQHPCPPHTSIVGRKH